MSIESSITAYKLACTRLELAVQGYYLSDDCVEIAAEVTELEFKILNWQPQSVDELTHKLTFAEDVIGVATDHQGPEQLWFEHLRQDLHNVAGRLLANAG